MEVILSTAFGVKAETQTVDNDPITELAKKAMAPHPLALVLCKSIIIYCNYKFTVTCLPAIVHHFDLQVATYGVIHTEVMDSKKLLGIFSSVALQA